MMTATLRRVGRGGVDMGIGYPQHYPLVFSTSTLEWRLNDFVNIEVDLGYKILHQHDLPAWLNSHLTVEAGKSQPDISAWMLQQKSAGCSSRGDKIRRAVSPPPLHNCH
ncbi:hypothetical protein J6590_015584 [Homalodisca vitripennis]|nr:hypothetical protein J6590_015584 [Homalodisca vitripennis]